MRDACPNPSLLAEYAAGSLTDPACAALEHHLLTCAACLTVVLERLPRGTAVGIPDVHVVSEVGRGSSGVVYKAWWTRGAAKLVALKVLTGGGDLAPNRFEREIAVLRKLDSPWIVKCHESGGREGSRYFVMDFVHGEHLDAYFERPQTNLATKLRIFERVCRGVSHAHALGVVHRDLKPRNILVDDDGEPHILDFGICSVGAADWTTDLRATITHTGAILGTIKYMSPEQAWGGVAGPVDPRSDLWSLGVLLHEIVTDGRHPYPLTGTREKSPVEAVLERIRRELPRPARLAHLPGGRDLEILIERCLTRDPAHRLDDAARLADDVARCARGERIRTRPHGLAYRASRVLVGAATRSRAAFWLVFMALTLGAWWGPVFVRRSGWIEPAGWSEVTPAALTGIADPWRLDSFVILGVTDETPAALAARGGWSGAHAEDADLRRHRAAYGALMKKLVEARPLAVIWDLWFRTPQPGDEALADGVNALEVAGVPVVLISLTHDDAGRPHLSDGILRALNQPPRQGAVVARDMTHRPGEFVIAHEKPAGPVIPSAALVLAEAIADPSSRIELELDEETRAIEVLYRVGEGAYRRDRGSWENLLIFKPDDLPGAARVACIRFELAPPSAWVERVIPLEQALGAEPDDLRERVGGRVVVIGDLRTQAASADPDRHAVAYPTGQVDDVPGCFLLTDAVRGLLSRRVVRGAHTSGMWTWALVAAAALTGCLIPARAALLRGFESRRARRVLLGTLGVVAAAAWAASLAADDRRAFVAASVAFGFAGSAWGAFVLEFTRNRYRFLDRRFAAANLPLERQSTITSTPPPTPPRGRE